uniref:Endonuclease/exonuclease/phosphatase domain-containing protein n=1 Tax=Tetranychus urticae TaxID=32264 RepID=T1K235_TETUR
MDYTVPKVSIVTVKQPNASAIACFDSESFQFVTKCSFELSTVTCGKARWNNITLCIIRGYFSSNNGRYSVDDSTADLKKIAVFLKALRLDILKLLVGDFNNTILESREFKEGIVSCGMELNGSSDHKIIRIKIDKNKLLKYAQNITRLDMSRFKDMDGFWFSVPLKIQTRLAKELILNGQCWTSKRRTKEMLLGVPGTLGLRMPDSANWPEHLKNWNTKNDYSIYAEFYEMI